MTIIPLLSQNKRNGKGFDLGNQTVLDLHDCTTVDYKKLRFNTPNLLNYLVCINYTNISLGGNWESDTVNLISVVIVFCQNDTVNNTCKTPQEIYNFLNTHHFAIFMYTANYFLDINDEVNPLKLHLNKFIIAIDPNFSKLNSIYFKSANITTDYGILTKMEKSYSIFGIQKSEYDIRTIQNASTDPMVIFQIFFSYNVESFYISFIKLQQVFANLGGIITVINIIFSNVAAVLNKHHKTVTLVNKLFDLSKIDNKEDLRKHVDISSRFNLS